MLNGQIMWQPNKENGGNEEKGMGCHGMVAGKDGFRKQVSKPDLRILTHIY